MRGTEGGSTALLPFLSGLATKFLVKDLGQNPECPSRRSLAELADRPALDAPDAVREHLARCACCAQNFAAFRAAACVGALPDRFVVPLVEIDLPPAVERAVEAYQILGVIRLETRSFKACEPEDWSPDPQSMRVNIVLDEGSDYLSLTLLDVPEDIASVTLTTPRGLEAMLKTSDGVFEFERTFDEFLADDGPPDTFVTFLNAGLLQAVFERAEQPGADFQAEVMDLLAAAGAVERAFDYVLPSGLHSDTHVRVGKLCHSEEWLRGIADALHRLFGDVTFDAIAAAGWPMATIARRMAGLRARPKKPIPHVVLCEGYSPPRLLGDLPVGSRVLILVDVVVTGGLVARLTSAVRRAGSVVVGTGTVIQSQHPHALTRDSLRSLARVPMHVVAPRDCPRCGRMERREFNPFAHCMTAKAPAARSPSQFLDYDPDAREFWECVDEVGAYEHHRVERGAHYIAFVDTLKMLEHVEVGKRVVGKLRDLLLDQAAPAEVLLVPNRKRAKVLAERLSEVLRLKGPRAKPPLVTARGQDGRWRLPRATRCRLYDKSVLIVDSAAGHGRTLDELSLLAQSCGASRVAGAVVLSRLTESAEESFRARLSGGFHRLYHLPVRPVLICGNDKDICAVCKRKAAVTKAAEESRLEAIKQLAAWLTQRGGQSCSRVESTGMAPTTRQLTLFPAESSFLATCSSQVASGVMLHSLHAAMTNGMAPLALPEMSDAQIPRRNRLAMLENLPVGVVEWSRGVLDRQLQDLLAREDTSSLWRASACVLARERHLDWVEHLAGFLGRCHELGSGPRPMFWNNLVCSAYIASHDDAPAQSELRRHLEGILRTHTGEHAAAGVRRILEAIGR